MKAIRVHQFGGPEVLRWEETPTPHPQSDQILVRIQAAGVNPVDTYIVSGQYSVKPELPFTPGFDGAGMIEELGRDVAGFQKGQRVYLSGSLTGTYAQYALCLPSQVHELPNAITFAQGAAVNVNYATAYRALYQRASARAGEMVLVHGASGGVGVAAVQLARALGLYVIGTAGTERGRALVQKLGAHSVLDHSKENYAEEILHITGGRGVNIILEMLANVNLNKDLGLLARSGRVVVIGSRGTVEIDPRLTMARDAAILGMSLLSASAADLESIHCALVAGLSNGTLAPVVGQEFKLEEAAQAQTAVMQPGAYGKIVLTC